MPQSASRKQTREALGATVALKKTYQDHGPALQSHSGIGKRIHRSLKGHIDGKFSPNRCYACNEPELFGPPAI